MPATSTRPIFRAHGACWELISYVFRHSLFTSMHPVIYELEVYARPATPVVDSEISVPIFEALPVDLLQLYIGGEIYGVNNFQSRFESTELGRRFAGSDRGGVPTRPVSTQRYLVFSAVLQRIDDAPREVTPQRQGQNPTQD